MHYNCQASHSAFAKSHWHPAAVMIKSRLRRSFQRPADFNQMAGARAFPTTTGSALWVVKADERARPTPAAAVTVGWKRPTPSVRLTAGDGGAGLLGDGAAGSVGGVKSHLTSCDGDGAQG